MKSYLNIIENDSQLHEGNNFIIVFHGYMHNDMHNKDV